MYVCIYTCSVVVRISCDCLMQEDVSVHVWLMTLRLYTDIFIAIFSQAYLCTYNNSHSALFHWLVQKKALYYNQCHALSPLSHDESCMNVQLTLLPSYSYSLPGPPTNVAQEWKPLSLNDPNLLPSTANITTIHPVAQPMPPLSLLIGWLGKALHHGSEY